MRLAIIGAGPAGVMAGINALGAADEIIFFDKKLALATILPTGGGRCNLAYAEFDNRELVNFYPRGQKFLLSVFSRFSTGDTITFFEDIGVKTYVQEDLRVFPESNSAKDVRNKLLKKLESPKVKFFKENVISLKNSNDKFFINTEKSTYTADKVIFAGGIKQNYELLQNCGIKLIAPKPALCALCVEDVDLYSLCGVSLKGLTAKISGVSVCLNGDILITHNSISGPLAYKISSVQAFSDFPYKINLNFTGQNFEYFDKELIKILDKNSKKSLINIVSEFVPKSFAEFLLKKINVDCFQKANQVNKSDRIAVSLALTNYSLNVISQKIDGEIVTAGGVDLDMINPKTMEYKDISGLYFCGEVLNVDGFTGGFNLQNCWSTGFLAGTAIVNNTKS